LFTFRTGTEFCTDILLDYRAKNMWSIDRSLISRFVASGKTLAEFS